MTLIKLREPSRHRLRRSILSMVGVAAIGLGAAACGSSGGSGTGHVTNTGGSSGTQQTTTTTAAQTGGAGF